MIDTRKMGERIAALRKQRGFTGEALAERLHVSPQAVSKWENDKSMPETAVLPALAAALECSIDHLLCPRELFILEAVYTDGQIHVPVTHLIDAMVRDNRLSVCVNAALLGVSIESERLKLLTVKFQAPKGTFFSYVPQDKDLLLDRNSVGFSEDNPFQVIGAYYGNSKDYSSVMGKMKHYEYFKWDRIAVNHETFPSSTASDDTEYLSLIYLNADGIHVISCPENHTIYYGNHHTQFQLQDNTKHILKNIPVLSWGEGMDCPWAGSLYAALKYMGESYTYHQIMGMSGACYRVGFTDVWDYSCTDALVSFDYATPLFKAIGYSFRMVDRLGKQKRKSERQAIMEDLQNGKPVLAIDLRVAPEWGVITGYVDDGDRFLCRTYFDKEVFASLEQGDGGNDEDRRTVFEDNEGYLFTDSWPFIIIHFCEKKDPPSPLDSLKASLAILIDSFHAGKSEGYYQGKGAYEAWMKALVRGCDFQLEIDREAVLRRLSVNDNMLCHLVDSRRAAAAYLRESAPLLAGRERTDLEKIAENCQAISDMAAAFRCGVCRLSGCGIAYNTVTAFGASTPALRKEQARMLESALVLEEENCCFAERIWKALEAPLTQKQ